jgi:hypothetical protein
MSRPSALPTAARLVAKSIDDLRQGQIAIRDATVSSPRTR